jgi:alpha-1,2-mannosyltransferase
VSVPDVGPSADRRPKAAWLVGTAVVVWAFIAFYLWFWGAKWAVDLRVYRDAAAYFVHHGSPYHSYFTESVLPFTYPPFSLLVMAPLTVAPLSLVKALWWVLDVGALVAVLSLAFRSALGVSRRRALLLSLALGAVCTIAFEPLRNNLDFGQVNLILMAMIVFDLLKVRGRGRGVLVGVAAAVKLTPLLYIAYFLVTGDRRSALRAGGTFVALSALPWAIIPSGATSYWLHEAFNASRPGQPGYVSDQSWNGVFHRPPFHGGAAGLVLWAVLSLATLAVGVAGSKLLVDLGRPVDAILTLALVELLVSPISWTHHWSWLVLAPVVAWERWGKDRPVLAALGVIIVLVLAEPYWWPITGWFGAILADSLTLAGAALLGVLTWRARSEIASRRSGGPSSDSGPKLEPLVGA